MIKTDELKAIIAAKGLKMKFVAEQLGLSSYGLSLKLDNKNEFKMSEVVSLCKLLDINEPEQRERIFFAYRLINNQL